MTDEDGEFDATRLASWLSAELDATVTDTEVLHDGLNLSIGVSTAETDDAYVVRRPNKLREAEGFNPLDVEYAILQRLDATNVSAPKPVAFCADESVLGEHFFVTTYLEGAGITVGSRLPQWFRTPAARECIGHLLVDSLAEIHTIDVDSFAEICERVSPAEQIERAIGRLDVARDVTGRDLAALRNVGDWLLANVPPDSTTAHIHGDFKPGNVFFAGTDDPEITGVVDWEAAFLGDPLTELGYLLCYWRDVDDPTLSLDELEATYAADELREVGEINENGLCPFTTEPGSPSRRELVSRYEEKTGRTFEHERFYRAHAAFLLATVWEDLHRHQLEAGAASDYAPLVDYTALVANEIVSGERPL